MTVTTNDDALGIDSSGGGSGGGTVEPYVLSVNSISSPYTVTHNLGYIPNVVVLNSEGRSLGGVIVDYYESDSGWDSENKLKLIFSGSLTGTVICS